MFNLKKAKAESVQNHEGRLDGTLERKNSLESEVVGPQDRMLKKLRKGEDRDTTTEDQLKAKREGNAAQGRITEGQLGHHELPEGYPARVGEAGDKLQMPPLAALNAAQEAERVRAYNDASTKDASTAFWDKYIGTQMDGKGATVPVQVPASGNQLQNSYDRLKSLKIDEMGKHDKVKEMVMASMRDADAMLYFVYHKAASEGRKLTAEEDVLVGGITNDKIKLAKLIA